MARHGSGTTNITGNAIAAESDASSNDLQVIVRGEVGSNSVATPVTGQTLETGGVSDIGWLSSIRKAITDRLPAALGGTTAANSLPVVLSSDGPFATQTGSITETAPGTDTASSGLNGRLQRIAQRLTSIIALLPTALGANGGLKIEGVASGTAVPVSGTFTSTPPVQTSVTPTISAAVYAPGDVMGAAQTHSPSGLGSGGTASLIHVAVKDKGLQNAPLELWVFDQALGTTPNADNGVWNPADADLDKLKAVIDLGGYHTGSLNSMAEWEGSRTIKSAATSFVCYLVTRGTPTPASTSDLIVELEWAVGS